MELLIVTLVFFFGAACFYLGMHAERASDEQDREELKALRRISLPQERTNGSGGGGR